MKEKLFVLFALLLFPNAFCQEVHLKNLKSTVDSLAAHLVQENEPGLSVGVVYRGKPILNSHFGLMNLDYEMKTSAGTAYNLASVSKHITAFGILLLEEDGKLKLQDKIGKYLPNLPENYKEVTINQLLHHTSGIPSTDNLKLFAGIPLDTPWTMTEELELLKKYSQLNFEPGTEFMYSNGGYSLLAAIIETAGGKDFGEFCDERIFEPLGLKAAAYDSFGKIIKNRAIGYRPAEDIFRNALTEAESVPGHSNFYFSMDDMLVWMNLLLQDNSSHRHHFARMMQPSFVIATGDTIPYSYGLNVKDYKGVKSVAHSGGTPGFASYIMLFPEQELGISVLTNNEKVNVGPVIRRLADEILAGFLQEETPVDRVAISLPEEKMKIWVGSYKMRDGMILQVLLKNGGLFLELPENQRFQLHPESEKDYFIKEFDAQLVFSETSKGKPSHFDLVQGTSVQKGNFLKPEELHQITPDQNTLTGMYHQQDLNITYHLEKNNGELILHLPETFKKYLNFSNVALQHISGDTFNSNHLGVIEFLRNEENKIKGFRFNDVGRLRNINLVKVN